MTRQSIFGRESRVLRFACFAMLTAIAAAGARPAAAAIPVPTGFTVDVASSARVLDALDMKRDGVISASEFYDIKYDEACDNPLLRIRARNKPALMIGNNSASAAPITSFTLKINDGPYSFGMGDVVGDNFTNFIKNSIYTDAGVSITGSSVSGDQKTLTVNFDGLAAGKMAIFNIDLDTTDPNGFAYPDYRMVLFGAPEDGGNPTTPATSTATFTNGTPAPNSVTMTLQFDQVDEEPNFYEMEVRPYHTMDPIDLHQMGTFVPEPSGALLAIAGISALCVRRRRK